MRSRSKPGLVGRWIAPPDSQDYQDTYGAMLKDFFGDDGILRGSAPTPRFAIVQQSLQRTPTPETRLGPVVSVDEKTGIDIGANALEKLAAQLESDGILHVLIAMHIYKEGYEPEVGNERFALDALLDRGHSYIHEGPDVWSRTLDEYPEAFTKDRLHPNERGGKIMAEAWYRTLAGDRTRMDVIESLNAREYDIDSVTSEYLQWRRSQSDN